MKEARGQARRPAGRPRDLGKAEAILDAAWSLFLARGVQAVPIEAIAAKAGVSKGTLYAAYSDKTALFEAAVLREMERIEAAQLMRPGDGANSFAETLRVFGVGIMSFLASEPAIGFYNALSAELRHHPDLARSFWNLGPGRTRSNLSALITAAATRGEISIGSPDHAADMLFGMWQGFTNLHLALGVQLNEEHASITERVDRGIAVFLRAFAPNATEGDGAGS